jgi:signal transduction histidine kinase/CHASE1-domain containing sensor protein
VTLEPSQQGRKLSSKIALPLFLFIFVVAALVIVGWSIDNVTLMRVLPQFTPMNPVTALSFMLIAVCLFVEYRQLPRSRRIVFLITGTFISIVGLAMLVMYVGGPDIFIDRILFSSKLGINRMAPTTALNFLIIGFCLLSYGRWHRLDRFLYGAVSAVSLYGLIAYLYNFVGVYGTAIYNPMAIHTAALFFLVSAYLFQRSMMQRGLFDSFTGLLRRRGLYIPIVMIIIFVIAMIVTGGIMSLLSANVRDQSQLNFRSHSAQISSFIQSRMDLYVGVSYGVQGLFAASDQVTSSEWGRYFDSLNVPVNFPGISGAAYAPLMSKKEVASLPYPIYPAADKDSYYPLAYRVNFIQSTSTAPLGYDYSSSPERLQAIQQSILLDKPISTPIVLGVSIKIPLFSVFYPIYKNDLPHNTPDERLKAVAGVISLSFRLEKIFPDLLLNPLFDKTIDTEIFDTADPNNLSSSTLLYATSNGFINEADNGFVRTAIIPVAGRKWTIRYSSSQNANLASIEAGASGIALGVGSLVSIILSVSAGVYIRSRERALTSKNIQLQTMIRNFPHAVFIEDENRQIILANQKILDVFSVKDTLENLIGMSVAQALARISALFKDPVALTRRSAEIITAGKAVADEKIELTNGTYLARSYVPLYYDGQAHGGLWIYKDITEEQKIDQMKTEFVSLASHQLRTPLTSIKWYNELLMDQNAGSVNAEQESYLKEIEDATERMVELVNSLLNVSRLELGTFAIEPRMADLLHVAEVAVKEQEPTFKEKGQTLTFEHPDALDQISIDEKITHIIIQNLLSNAHKYTPEKGKIELSIKTIGSKGSGGYVEIICKDNGYGIPRSQQSRIFSKLFRADNVRTLDVEGTGLGLYIIKTVVDAAGCDISFASEEGKGTAFTFKVPLSGMKGRSGGKALSSEKE